MTQDKTNNSAERNAGNLTKALAVAVLVLAAIVAYLLLFAGQQTYQAAAGQTPLSIGSAVPTQNVSIIDDTFVPYAVRINAGDNLTWYNNDGKIHEIVDIQGNSGFLGGGQYYTQQFNTTGTYWYYDSVTGIQGVVFVQ
jgi:plastocyanin